MSASPHSDPAVLDPVPRSRANASQRMLALLAGLLTLPVALTCLLGVVIAARLLQHPAPRSSHDGDPCCPLPGSWSDVAIGVIATPTLLAITAGLLVAFVALVTVAGTGRLPAFITRRRRVLGNLSVLCLAGLAVLAFAWMLSGERL